MAPPGTALPTRPAKSAAASRATAQRKRVVISARGNRGSDPAEDAEEEAAAAAQAEALETLVKQDFRPAGLEPPGETYFTVEDEGLLASVQALFGAVAVVDAGGGGGEASVCYASDGFLELLGYELTDIITQDVIAVLSDGSDAETTEALRQAYHGTTAVSLELPCVGKDGSKVKCAITVLPIKTSGGSVEKYLSLLAAAGGNEELSRLRRADKLERLVMAVLVADVKSELEMPVVDFSHDAGEHLRLRDGQLLGKSVLSLAGPDTDRLAKEGLLLAHMDKKPGAAKLLLYKGDGEPFWAYVASLPLSRPAGPAPGRSMIRRREGSSAVSGASAALRDNLAPGSPLKLRNAQAVVDQHLNVLVDITRTNLRKIGKWQMGKVIGRGAQGVVRLGRDMGGDRVAIKMVDASSFRNIGDIDRVQDEIAVLCKLKHKNIIRLVDTHFVNNAFYFAMEWASGGPLVDYIYKQPDKRLAEPEARVIFSQIVEALDYCHRRRVVHRDLKPENVLLDENNVVKIADFGLAAITAPFDDSLTLMCGTPEFTAPEIVAGREYDGSSVDIWSLGVMLFEFLSGYLPFKAPDQKELFRLIAKGEAARLPSDVSMEAADLIRNMLQVKVEHRLSLDEIQSHPWYCGKTSMRGGGGARRSSQVHESLRLVLPEVPKPAGSDAEEGKEGKEQKKTVAVASPDSAPPRPVPVPATASRSAVDKKSASAGGVEGSPAKAGGSRVGTYRVGGGAAAAKAAAAGGSAGSAGAAGKPGGAVGPYGRTRVVAPRVRPNVSHTRSSDRN